jgi:hypothetical protein
MFSRVEWLIIGICLAIWGLVVWGGHLFVPDDVYFYLHIADQIVTGHGSTFNGITPTNGYHPLWMIPCILLRLVVSDRQRFVQAMFVVCAVLHVVALFLLARLLGRTGIRQRWPGLLLLGYYLAANPPGSEMHISLVLLLLLLGQATAELQEATGPRALLLLGVYAGFAELARLDNVFLIGLIVLAVLSTRRTSFVRDALLVGIPALIIVVPYLAWNRIDFGAFVPISGRVKATFAHPGLLKLGAQGIFLFIGALPLGFLWSDRLRLPRVLLFAMSGAALIHTAYVAFGMEGSWPWYFATELLATCLSASLVFERLAESVPTRILTAASALAVVVLMAAAVNRRVHQARTPPPYYLASAEAIDDIVPPGEAIATTVSPGSMAYFSHRSVFAFDGLTNDFAYHQDAARGGLQSYLRAHRITYLYSVAPASDEALKFAAKTKIEGQQEDTAYLLAPDGHSVQSLTIFSGVLGIPLGTFDLSRLKEVRRGFCSRDVAIWKFD